MIISHEHQFIFIKTHKTAGTSLEILLSGICGNKDIIVRHKDVNAHQLREDLGIRGPQNDLIPVLKYQLQDWKQLIKNGTRRSFKSHETATYVKRYLRRKVWKDYYKFCFERDPYERLISFAHFYRARRGAQGTINDIIPQIIRQRGPHSTFYRLEDKVLVDRVYPYEKLHEALVDISQKINLKENLDISNIQAKGSFRTDRRPASQVLSRETISLINESQKDVFELMGYPMLEPK